ATLPTINTNSFHQARHVMTNVAPLRRQTGHRAYRWSSTGSQVARTNASYCRPGKPPMPAATAGRDHQRQPTVAYQLHHWSPASTLRFLAHTIRLSNLQRQVSHACGFVPWRDVEACNDVLDDSQATTRSAR